MKKGKRIFALIGAIALVLMYISTLVFALIDPSVSGGLLKASIACTVILPVLLYAYSLVYRLSKKNNDNSDILEEETSDNSTKK